jgi:hypothetical protein
MPAGAVQPVEQCHHVRGHFGLFVEGIAQRRGDRIAGARALDAISAVLGPGG